MRKRANTQTRNVKTRCAASDCSENRWRFCSLLLASALTGVCRCRWKTPLAEASCRPLSSQFTALMNPLSPTNASTLSLTVSSIAMELLVNFGDFRLTVLVVENTTFCVAESVTT